ncbi:MAG: dethiobiotin synthase [Mycobacteriaceae bacterium]|nr:dethiobiotin synthase [Mycobacteriaceae bacterium]
MTVLAITGTCTGVGKTIATAALACHARYAGIDVAVCKPVQTGAAVGDDDLAVVAELSGVTELARVAQYPQPMAPVAAARLAGMSLPTRGQVLHLVQELDNPGQLTLVEGAGGLLVELGADGVTLRDCAADLGAAVLIVVTATLGTLNHTALTLEALANKGVASAGLVIGSWPSQPSAVEISNRSALAELAPIRAVLPVGAGALAAPDFAEMSATAFDRQWVTSLVG